MPNSMSETELMLAGYGLTTAEILYRMPDFRDLVQSYLWQEYDLAPGFHILYGFIRFWNENLAGPIISVRYTHQKLIRPGEWKKVDGELLLN